MSKKLIITILFILTIIFLRSITIIENLSIDRFMKGVNNKQKDEYLRSNYQDESIINADQIKIYSNEFKKSKVKKINHKFFEKTDWNYKYFYRNINFYNNIFKDSLEIRGSEFNDVLIENSEVSSFFNFKYITFNNFRSTSSNFSDDFLLHGCYINDFTLNKCSFKKVLFVGTKYNGNVLFKHCTFENAIFVGDIYYGNVKFSDCKITDKLLYDLSIFNSLVKFEKCIFSKGFNIGGDRSIQEAYSKLHDEIIFKECEFEDKLFCRAIFDSLVCFSDCSFMYASFEKCVFSDLLLIKYCWFQNSISLFNSTINEITTFQVLFESDVDLSFTEISDSISFIDTQFKGELIFHNTVLPQYIDLRGSSFRNDLNFWNTTFSDSLELCKICLERADIEKIELDYNKFQLDFKEFKNDWQKQEYLYLRLLQNFKNRDNKSSYEKLHKEYLGKILERKWTEKQLSVSIQFLKKIWWNYGYNKEFIFYWTLVFIFLFTIINHRYYFFLNDRVYCIPLLKKRSLYNVFLYTCVIFFGLKLNLDVLKKVETTKDKVMQIYIFAIYIIGFICLAYMINSILSKW